MRIGVARQLEMLEDVLRDALGPALILGACRAGEWAILSLPQAPLRHLGVPFGEACIQRRHEATPICLRRE